MLLNERILLYVIINDYQINQIWIQILKLEEKQPIKFN